MDSLVQFLYTCSQRSIHTECIPVTFKDKEKMSAVDERGSAEKMEDNSIDPSASSSPCSFSFRFGKPWSESPFGHWVIIFQKHMVNICQNWWHDWLLPYSRAFSYLRLAVSVFQFLFFSLKRMNGLSAHKIKYRLSLLDNDLKIFRTDRHDKIWSIC